MNRYADPFDLHVEVLLRLRRLAGAAVYDRALEAARDAVARVVLAEAERVAGVGRERPSGTVVRLRRPVQASADADAGR